MRRCEELPAASQTSQRLTCRKSGFCEDYIERLQVLRGIPHSLTQIYNYTPYRAFHPGSALCLCGKFPLMGGGCPLSGAQLAFLIRSASMSRAFDLRQISSLSPWPDGRGYFVPKRGEGSALNPMSFLDISDTPKMAVFSSVFRRDFPNSDLMLLAAI